MRRLLYTLLLLPQLASAQLMSKYFTIESNCNDITAPVRSIISQDTIFSININEPISALSVSGTVSLQNNDSSYVRVILKDNYNYEYLVYENYLLLSDSLTSNFSNTAIETITLENITPQNIIVELRDATLKLQSFTYTPASASFRRVTNVKQQAQYIVDKLNENLQKHNKTWRAGITSMAEKSYEDKKAMFGEKVPVLYGFEYYAGGIFVMPNSNDLHNRDSTNQFVKEWDWRNRHGKNWMTPTKNQGGCGSCGVFSAVGALEAYVNLFFNQKLDVNLSEEEIISCVPNFICSGTGAGMTQGTALQYIENNGIVPEACFPYTAFVQDCDMKCQNPNDIISVDSHHSFSYTLGEDYIKQRVFKSPIPFGVFPWRHAIVLSGYKNVEIGDTIYTGLYSRIIIDSISHSDMIGKTAWLIKNSWGENWGKNGYAYIVVSQSDLAWLYYIEGNIHSQIYNDTDVVCEDADGDGYYFWGIGPKPAHCPSWVPDSPDGDDSNINFGPTDEYGNLDILIPNGITIDSAVTYSTNQTLLNRIGVVNNGMLIITGNISMASDAIIRVCENGKLIVDGGSLQNANLQLIPGCEVIVRNGGTINMANGKEFNAPIKAIVTVSQGGIR